MTLHTDKLFAIIMKARIQKGYSQSFMGHKLGISQKAYSFLEAGKSKMDLTKFILIADLLEMHPMTMIEKVIQGQQSWQTIANTEERLMKEIEGLETQISYLKSHIGFLKETINKILDKQEQPLEM